MKIKIDKLDTLWAKCVKLRDKKVCQKCGKYLETHANASHIISRRNHHTRWVLDGGVTLCCGCHLSWAHYHPIEFEKWVKARLGTYRYTKLRELANQTDKVDKDLAETVLKSELKKLEESK